MSEISTALRNIVITGLMGTGKTTIGRLVSLELNRKFIDTDEYIVEHYGTDSSDPETIARNIASHYR